MDVTQGPKLWVSAQILSLLAAAAPPARAQACTAPEGPVALVLSGGGAKGFAHIGVLEQLDRRGVRPDLVVGTSMGAIMGAMYASGYPARVIDSLVRALPLTALFRSHAPRGPRAWEGMPPLVVWAQGERGFALQTTAVSEAETNALLGAALLRGNLLARGDFDALPIPFRAVATDLIDRTAVVLGHGDLARAVRASSAIPLLFVPEVIDGRVLVDGGLSANVPVAIARAAGARRVIVSDVSEPRRDTIDVRAPVEVADQLLAFLFRQPPDSLGPHDVVVRPNVEEFRALDFAPASVERVIALGRASADSAFTAACGLGGGTPRASTVAELPVLRVAEVRAADGDLEETLYLQRLLGLEPGGTVRADALRRHVLQLSHADPFEAVWLHPSGSGDTVRFEPVVRLAARRVAAMGLAYDNELGGRMWAGLLVRRGLGTRFDGSGVITLGELRRDLRLGVRRHFGLGLRRTTPMMLVTLASEDVRAFDSSGVELPALDTKEAVGFAGVEQGLGRSWAVRLGGEGRWWRNPDRSTGRTGGGLFRLSRHDAVGRREVLGELIWSGTVRRVEAEITGHGETGAVLLVPRVRVGWGERLPIHLRFPLGGADGFPGLHLGERRGDREVLASAQLAVRFRGPLAARLLVAGGRTATGGSLFGEDGWLGGVRAGLGADTPVGPILAEYGVATNGRGAVFVRVGRWF